VRRFIRFYTGFASKADYGKVSVIFAHYVFASGMERLFFTKESKKQWWKRLWFQFGVPICFSNRSI
jgi:hypothetical protein